MSQLPLRTLVLGAGVIGSVYAARLQEAGYTVTLLARGQHAADLLASGLFLEDAYTGQSMTSHVRIIERLTPDDIYDLALVCVRLDQVAATVPDLVVFLLNNPAGTQPLVEQLGAQRVILGFPVIGGTRDGTRVRYVRIHQQPTTLGEVDGRITSRLRQLAIMLERAGFSVALSRNMDGWLKTHAVFVSCVSAALALEGGDSVRLGRNRAHVELMVNAIQEGFAALQSVGILLAPFNLQLMFRWMPRWFAVRYWQRALQTSVGTLAIAPHARAARAEIGFLAGEVLELLQASSVPTPALQRLLAALTGPVLETDDRPLGRA